MGLHFNLNPLKQGTGTADHLTLLRLFHLVRKSDMVSKARVAPLKQNSKKSQRQGACAEFLCSVFGQQHPPKCSKNARILHGGGFYQCLTPCKFLKKSIQPVKNCGIVEKIGKK